MDCFSRLANCLDSLQGVRPAMSAAAGGGEGREEERRMEERARAAGSDLRSWGDSVDDEQEMGRRGLGRGEGGLDLEKSFGSVGEVMEVRIAIVALLLLLRATGSGFWR